MLENLGCDNSASAECLCLKDKIHPAGLAGHRIAAALTLQTLSTALIDDNLDLIGHCSGGSSDSGASGLVAPRIWPEHNSPLFATESELSELHPVARLESSDLVQALTRADCGKPERGWGVAIPSHVCQERPAKGASGWVACSGLRNNNIKKSSNYQELVKRLKCRHRGLIFENQEPRGQAFTATIHISPTTSETFSAPRLQVGLVILRSYEGFGAFQAKIEAPAATGQWVDQTGYHDDHTSVAEYSSVGIFEKPFPESFNITVRAPSKGLANESKFKVMAIIVTPLFQAGPAFQKVAATLQELGLPGNFVNRA